MVLALPARVADCLDWEGLDAVPMVAPVQARAHALPVVVHLLWYPREAKGESPGIPIPEHVEGQTLHYQQSRL